MEIFFLLDNFDIGSQSDLLLITYKQTFVHLYTYLLYIYIMHCTQAGCGRLWVRLRFEEVTYLIFSLSATIYTIRRERKSRNSVENGERDQSVFAVGS